MVSRWLYNVGQHSDERIVLSVFAAFLAVIVTLFAASISQGDTIEPYRSICMIRMAKGSGSGTLIATNKQGQGLVLSCRHVCDYVGNRVLVSFLWAGGGETYLGEVVKVVKGSGFESDIALIVIPGVPLGVKPRPVAHFDVTRGPWVGAGFRTGVMRITGCIQQALVRPDGLIVFPDALIQGQSGGPLFNRRGEVVGIVVGSDFISTSVAADGVLLRQTVAEFVR